MRYLGLDVGNRRVGVAVGNSELRMATPLDVVERKRIEDDARRFLAWAKEYDAEAIVVGLPRNADNSAGEQEAATRAYCAQLEKYIPLPFYFMDERYSTAAALAQQRERGVSEKRGRATIDASAAAVILQDFLDGLEG